MACAKYVNTRFGINTRANQNPLVASCAATVTRLLNNNPDRLGWLIINLGANDIYIAFDETVALTKGILLGSSGGQASANVNDDFELTTYPVFGIGNGGASTVFILEIEAEPGA